MTLTADHTFNFFPSDTAGSVGYRALTAGPDGNVWFTQDYGPVIGRITPSGGITNFALSGTKYLKDISLGSDGNIWYIANTVGSGVIGRLIPP